MVGSNIVTGLSILDMWSVFCVLYVAVGILYSDHHLGLYVPDKWSVLFVPYMGCGI